MELELRKHSVQPDHAADIARIRHFLLFYTETTTPKYDLTKAKIEIELDDIAVFDDTGLHTRILENTPTYHKLFYAAVDEILGFESNNVFIYQRVTRMKEKFPEKKISDFIPPSLLRSYEINFRIGFLGKVRIDEMGSRFVGKLVRVSGVVTRVTQARPQADVLVYVCDCGAETYQSIESSEFELLSTCSACRKKISMHTRASKFVRSFVVTLQENEDLKTTPSVLRVETSVAVKPGDLVTVDGVLLVRKGKIRNSLLLDTYFYAFSVENNDKRTAEKTAEVVDNCAAQVDILKLFAPEIYGMDDAKKLIMLMLIGAESKNNPLVRSNIHGLIVGDPGVCKTQLLKAAAAIGGVYAAARSTSSVGLTAAVVKNEDEISLEGGALVLADNKICAIDELDKMETDTLTSLHEVMEQQSISMSKAGINTKLNARCSVLCAANFIKNKGSVEAMTGLKSSLISRFDVVLLLKDVVDERRDRELADFITKVRGEVDSKDIDKKNSIDNENNKENSINTTVDIRINEGDAIQKIRDYVERVKKIEPVVGDDIKQRLVDLYVLERKNNAITPRFLLSLTRLSIAHARLRGSGVVAHCDVNEARRLALINTNNLSYIYNYIVKLNSRVEVENLYSLFGKGNVDRVLDEFVKLGVFYVDDGFVGVYENN